MSEKEICVDVLILIAGRREAVNRWFIGVEGAVDECGGDVSMVALEAREGSQGQNKAKSGAVNDGGKCLEVVLILDLCVALADEAGSVSFELSLLVSFVLVNPFANNNNLPRMTLALGGRSDFGTSSQQCRARSLDISRSMATFQSLASGAEMACL